MMRTLFTTAALGLALAVTPAALAEGGTGRLELRGAVASVGEEAIVVESGGARLRCLVGERSPSLSGLVPGAVVGISCKRVEGINVLVEVQRDVTEGQSRGWKRKIELTGTVTEVSDARIAVARGGRAAIACGLSKDTAELVEDVEVGDRVKVLCGRLLGSTDYALLKLRVKRRAVTEIAGVVVASDGASLAVKSLEKGTSLTCEVPDDDEARELVDALEPGDPVEMQCRGGVLARLVLLEDEEPADEDAPAEAPRGKEDVAGKVVVNGAGSLSIAGEKGRTLTCTLPANADLAYVATLAVGTKAAMLCDGGVVVKVKRLEEQAQTTWAIGVIASISPDRITVTTDGGSKSCFVPEALRPQVAERTVGQKVKIVCAPAEGGRLDLTTIYLLA